jgi:hypothetical protein
MIEEPLENAVSQLMSMGFGFSRQEAIARLQVRLQLHAIFSFIFFVPFLILEFFAVSVVRALQRIMQWKDSC